VAKYNRSWLVVLLASLAIPSTVFADDVDTCLNNVSAINQRGSEITSLASQANSELDAIRASQPDMDDAVFMGKVDVAYGPVRKLCQELRFHETKELCASVINNGTAGGRLSQVQEAASSLDNWAGPCEAQ